MASFDSYFPDPQWHPAGEILSLVHPHLPQFRFDIDLPLLSPPTTTPEQLTTPSYPHLPFELPPAASPANLQSPNMPSPEPPFVGQAAVHPPADPLPIPAQVPVPQLTKKRINKFYFCPYTEGGNICGKVSWSCSSDKTIRRHMKNKHPPFTSNSRVWKCPNPRCGHRTGSFMRRDLLLNHRKNSCNPKHLRRNPDFIPLPDIVEGSDAELKRWTYAAADQRKAIKQMLMTGTPWSVDLLQPVRL